MPQYYYTKCLLLLLYSQTLFGQFDNIAIFNGSNDYFEVNDNNSIDFTDEMTIEAWVYVACDATSYRGIVTKQWCGGGGDVAFALGVRYGDLEWTWFEPNATSCPQSNTYKASGVIPHSEWLHIAVVHTSTSVAFYLNGTPINGFLSNGSAYSALKNSTQSLKIGTYRSLNNTLKHHFIGAMDEIRLWNYARTPAEIASNYNTTLTGNESELIAYYDMNLSAAGMGIVLLNRALNTNTLNDALANGGTAITPYFLEATDELSFFNGGTSTVDVEICEGEFHIAQGGQQTTAGVYIDVIQLGNCDSVVITNLTINNEPCEDCNGTLFGTAIIDDCGVCIEPNHPDFNQSCADCNGIPFGTAVIDDCGVCIESNHPDFNQSCADCNGVPFGTAIIDICGVCIEPNHPDFNQSCIDCNGIPFGTSVVDACDVCLDPLADEFNSCVEIIFPTAFSPNFDGVNDYFQAYGYLDLVEDMEVNIFNRFGEKVFTSNQIDFVWDGKVNGQGQNIGVFVYYVEIKFENENRVVKGNVTLIK